MAKHGNTNQCFVSTRLEISKYHHYTGRVGLLLILQLLKKDSLSTMGLPFVHQISLAESKNGMQYKLGPAMMFCCFINLCNYSDNYDEPQSSSYVPSWLTMGTYQQYSVLKTTAKTCQGYFVHRDASGSHHPICSKWCCNIFIPTFAALTFHHLIKQSVLNYMEHMGI